MTWRELCGMKAKEAFVLRAAESGANISELCREYGISRKTAYKWLNRYAKGGLAGLEDQPRVPRGNPLGVSAEVVAEVVLIRGAHPWGARKIAEILRREHPEWETPSPRSVHRILVRTGILQPGRRRRRDRSSNAPKSPPRVVFSKPNDLWTVDFKGWWLSINKDRCEPLTIRDAHSRYVLHIEVLSSTRQEPVREVFKRIFELYGLPVAILTDNGPPWVMTHGPLGLTRLSAWWLSLGIEHFRSRPAKPQDNGGHERMHRDIAEELQAFASLTRELQQEACDRFRHDFNCHRPHESLKMKYPADVYKRSEVIYEDAPTEPQYPRDFLVRKVSQAGCVTLGPHTLYLTRALQREHIGIKHISPQQVEVYYYHKKIGDADLRSNPTRVRAINWRDSAVVLPTAA
jgi:putative transposase